MVDLSQMKDDMMDKSDKLKDEKGEDIEKIRERMQNQKDSGTTSE